MHPVERKAVLDSMVILVDRREQDTERSKRRYQSFGSPFHKATLSYGDYTYNAVLPDGTPIFQEDKTISGLCVVERKMSLDELAQCFTHERARFQREFERAKAAGARVVLLVEDASYERLLLGKYRSRFNPVAFLASLTAYATRYGAQVVFCKQETSGRLIKEYLYRDLKERLERGEFDEL